MKYRMQKFEQKFENGEVLVEYGIDYDSLNENEKSLFYIKWDGWNEENIQSLINQINSLQGEDYFDYIVEETELRVSIDSEYVLFFDWKTESFDEDFRWSTSKFIQFLENFKNFVRENS